MFNQDEEMREIVSYTKNGEPVYQKKKGPLAEGGPKKFRSTMSAEKDSTKPSESIAVVPHHAPSLDWTVLQKQCVAFIASGFLPEHITHHQGKPLEEKIAVAKALTIAIKGRELGVPPMQAFSSITVIKGKPCLSSELMLALIYQRVKGAKVTFLTPPEKQHLECVVEMQRPNGSPMQFRFSIEDARQAGIAQGGAWTKYPQAMLRARAISAGARAVFPDCIMGCYTPEELGGEVLDAEFSVEALHNAEPELPLEDVEPSAPEPISTALNEVVKTTTRPKQADYPRAAPGWQDEPCTEAQQKRLWAMCKGNQAVRDELLFEMFGADVVDASENKITASLLTKGEIQEVFKRLEADGMAS